MNLPRRTAAVLVAMALSASASAHSKLLSSTPASDAVLTGAPSSIALDFNEDVEIAFTTVSVTGPATQTMKLDATNAVGDRSNVVANLPALAPGAYRVSWTTVGHDGHHVKGAFAFSVR